MNIHDKYAVHPWNPARKRIVPNSARRVKDRLSRHALKGLSLAVGTGSVFSMNLMGGARGFTRQRLMHQPQGEHQREFWMRTLCMKQPLSLTSRWNSTSTRIRHLLLNRERLIIPAIQYDPRIDGDGEIHIGHKRFICFYKREALDGIDGYAIKIKDHITINVREDLTYQLQLVVVYDLVHSLKQHELTVVLYKLPQPHPTITFIDTMQV